MHALGITPEEFQQIVRSCQRVLINDFTPADDVQHFLVAKLRDGFPSTAATIARLNTAQTEELQREIVRAVKLDESYAQWM